MKILTRIHRRVADPFAGMSAVRATNTASEISGLAWGAVALLVLTSAGAWSQQSPTTLKGGVEYSDTSSLSCEQKNADNPYAGMNPLVCHGVSAPTDSRGQCSLGGMQVLKKVENTCYYCSPITSPPSIIIPMDQLATADAQGWRCGVDQADGCMAICSGGNTFNPLPGSVAAGGGSVGSPTNGGGPPSPSGGNSSPGANACQPFGPGGYDYCQNPVGTRLPAGCTCNRSSPTAAQPPASPSAANATNQLLADAQTMLQNAGRISKSMTDAMDVTKHNNVGIGVALSASFGAMGKMMGVAAQEYQALAAAGKAAAENGSVLQIAGQAATESGVVANQAAQTAARLGSAGATGTAAAATTSTYLEGAVLQSSGQMAQGDLPICAVLSCVRLGQLLGRNIPIFRFMENFVPKVNVVPGQATVGGGLTAQQVVTGLKATGINAEVGNGMTDMMNKVRAGTPVIAGVYTAGANSPLHAVVIQSVDTSGPAMLTIYDPVGNVYTQAAKTFAKYFTDVFVTPL